MYDGIIANVYCIKVDMWIQVDDTTYGFILVCPKQLEIKRLGFLDV
jgi:hypothetical protein